MVDHHHHRTSSIKDSLISRILSIHLLEKQVKYIENLQKNFLNTFSGDILAKVSLIGSGKIILIVLTLMLWLWRPNLAWGPTRAASVALSMVGIVKALFKGPRPYWLSKSLITLDPTLEVSYGFPSGHTAAVAATYGFIGIHESSIAFIFTLLLLAIVAISRVYTAAHFLHDVGGGAILGLGVLSFLLMLDSLNLTHLELAMFSFFLSSFTLLIVLSQFGIKEVPFKLVQEGLAGSGFLLGLGLTHLLEDNVRISVQLERDALPLVACVFGIFGIVFFDKIVKMTHKHSDNLSLLGVMICLLGYASINVWALWIIPLFVQDYLL